jgi:hypothetical protein
MGDRLSVAVVDWPEFDNATRVPGNDEANREVLQIFSNDPA